MFETLHRYIVSLSRIFAFIHSNHSHVCFTATAHYCHYYSFPTANWLLKHHKPSNRSDMCYFAKSHRQTFMFEELNERESIAFICINYKLNFNLKQVE